MSRTESRHEVEGVTPEVSLSPGVQLRRAREARDESVNEVAFALKLHPRQITALEEDDFAALPGEAFVRGFLRNYARYLRLDPVPLLAQVAEMGGAQRADLSPVRNAEGELPNGGAARRPVLPLGGLIVVLLLLLAVGWYFDWFRTTSSTELTLDVQGQSSGQSGAATLLAEPLARSAPPASVLALPEGAAESAGAPENLVPPTATEVVTEPAAEGNVEANAQGGGESAAETDQSAAVAPAQTSPAEAAADAVQTQIAPGDQPDSANLAESTAARLQFHFSGESWVEVRNGKGTVIHSGVNQPGTSRQIHGEPPFALTIGNAASVRVEFDGKPIDLAGRTKGAVARLTVE